MIMDVYQLKGDGFNDDEIRQIQQHCDTALKARKYSNHVALVKLNDAYKLCYRTIAETMNQLRPGCWRDEPVPSRKRTTKTKRALHRGESMMA